MLFQKYVDGFVFLFLEESFSRILVIVSNMAVIMPPEKNEVATARSCLVNSSSKTMYSEIITMQMDRKKQMNEITTMVVSILKPGFSLPLIHGEFSYSLRS